MTTMDELISDLNDRITEEFEDLYEYPRQRNDNLCELAEEQVPDSRTKLAELLVSDHSLGTGDSDYLGENPDAWDIIQSALHAPLYQAAQAKYKELEESYEDMKDTLEGMGYMSGLKGSKGDKNRWYIYWEDEDCKETIVCDGFKSEMETWKWLDLNEEHLDSTLKSPESESK